MKTQDPVTEYIPSRSARGRLMLFVAFLIVALGIPYLFSMRDKPIDSFPTAAQIFKAGSFMPEGKCVEVSKEATPISPDVRALDLACSKMRSEVIWGFSMTNHYSKPVTVRRFGLQGSSQGLGLGLIDVRAWPLGDDSLPIEERFRHGRQFEDFRLEPGDTQVVAFRAELLGCEDQPNAPKGVEFAMKIDRDSISVSIGNYGKDLQWVLPTELWLESTHACKA